MRIVLSICLLLAGGTAWTQGMPQLGARAMGLGGAFVGLVDDPSAVHWNPAGLGLQRPGGLFVYGLDGRVQGDLTAQLENLTLLQPTGEDIERRAGDALRARQILEQMAAEPASLESIDSLGGFGSSGKYAFSIYRTRYATSTPVVDLVHTEASDDPETSFTYNESTLELTFLEVQNYDLSLAGSLGDPRFVFGINLRYLRGKTRFGEESLFGLGNFDVNDLMDLASDQQPAIKSSTWGLDLGVLLEPSPKFRIGLVGKCLNKPKFDTADGELELDSLWRAGVAVFPHPSVLLTADVDLKQADRIDGMPQDRAFSFGSEVGLARGQFRLRGGMSIPWGYDGQRPPRYSGGLGVSVAGWIVDAAVVSAFDEGATSFVIQAGYLSP